MEERGEEGEGWSVEVRAEMGIDDEDDEDERSCDV